MFIITLALMTMLTTERKILINVLGSACCAIVMAIYATIFAYSLHVTAHAFGVVKGD
jgi:hypothetical protein